MLKANKENINTINKYFSKLMIRASFMHPKGTFSEL